MAAFDFPTNPGDGQSYQPPGGPEYIWREYAWRRHAPDYAGATSFPTRDLFVQYVAQGQPRIEGRVYTAGGYDYLAKYGSTAIPDLPGLIPFGDIHVEHFGAVADMTWELLNFTQSNTNQEAGKFLAPWRLTGTDQLAKFILADNYANATKGEFFIDGVVEGNTKSGYFIDAQFILKSMMRSRRQFRNYLWARTTNVYHSNIVITSPDADPFTYPHTPQKKRGAKGFIEICQYAYTGVAKPAGHGCIGCGISIGSAIAPTGGVAIATRQPAVVPPMPASNTHIPFITDVEIDVRFVRAGHGVREGFPGITQISNSSYLFFGVGGIEHCHFNLGIREQTNRSSNGLGICHWNLMYDGSAGGDPLTNYSAMIPTETFHCCDTKVEFADEVNMFDTPHGFQAVWEFASAGHVETGPLSCAGCYPVSISPGDLINHYTNPAQKEKIGKAIKVGKINAVDVPIGGDPYTPYANGAGANVYARGFGTSKFDVDIYETTTNRSICRQLECDITYEGLSLVRTGKNGFVPRWNGRAIYMQGVQGKLTFGAITTFGIGRGYEIEYCDGDQQLNYIEGDGCLLYEFSRGGRLLQTDTNRNVEGYVDNILDGGYRPGMGPGTRAVSIGGGSYSTIVDNAPDPANRINTTTKTYIVPFGGADDDVYRGTPLTFTNPDGTVVQTVTATEFIQGRSASATGIIEVTAVAITGISNSAPGQLGVITAPNHAFTQGMWITIAGVAAPAVTPPLLSMTQINGRDGRVIPIDANTFSIEDLDTSIYGPYGSGGTATQKLPTIPIANITQADQAVVTTTKDHNYLQGQFVGIYNVVGLSLPTPGIAYTVTKISKGNPAVVTVDIADIKQFYNGQEVTIVGADASHVAANGRHVVAGFNLAAKTFQLAGVDTSAAASDQTGAGMSAAPHKSGINGKTGKIVSTNGDFEYTIAIDTLVSPALTPFIAGGGSIEAFEGVAYLAHTPLRVPAVNGQTVTVDEFCRVKQLSLTSQGGETALRLLSASADQCDMHGLRSSGKYGANMTNGRLSLKGPLPMTVGAIVAADNYTIKGDGKSLFSMADGTIADNPDVAFHIFMDKDTATNSVGHVDLRNCRITNIAKLMEGNKSKLRFALSMAGCTDTQVNQALSHPARQGQDADNVAGGQGFYNFGDDGILRCWVRLLPTLADGTFTWTFPAAFNGGAATVSVAGNIATTTSVVRTLLISPPSSTAVTGSVIGGTAQVFSLMLQATGRWFPE